MDKKLNVLIEKAMLQLKGFGLKDETLESYEYRAFHPIEGFFDSKDAVYYDEKLMNELQSRYQLQLKKGMISRRTFNWRNRGIAIIIEIYQSGHFKWKVFSKKEKESLSDYFEDITVSFVNSLGDLKRKRIYESVIRRFCIFLMKHGHKDFFSVTGIVVRNFLIDISSDKPKSMDDVITILRRLFVYLNENAGVENHFCTILAAPHSRGRKVYPCMMPDELVSLVNGIGRNTPVGKRNYAVLSIALSTGLRSGDIASLKLTDIDWRNKEIHLLQGKTQKQIILPMDKNAGNALADYILNGRPASESKNIFLRSYAPYSGFHDGVSIACIFRKYLKSASIIHETGDGKTMHGIRRMLGTEMTSEGIPVTMVSQILGHKGMDAAKQYISLDISGLRQCTLGFDSLGGAAL